MKRFLLTTAAILILLLVCFAGYVQYQKWSSFKTLIPKNATALIRVNVYGMIQSAAWDYVTASSGKKKEKKDASSGKSRSSGMELPANLFVYSVAGKAPSTLFTSLAVKNVTDFEATVKKLLNDGPITHTNTGFNTVISTDGKLTVAYNKITAAIAFSVNGEEVLSVLQDVLLQQNLVSVKDSRFKDIANQSDHVLYLDGTQHRAELNFKDGAITLDALLSVNGIRAAAQSTHLVVNPQSTATLWLNADVRSLVAGKIYTVGPYTLPADSLLKYYGNAVQLTVKGTTLQKETIVTYGYNDNFEKVAQTEVHETTVPDLQLSINATAGLLDYLQRQGILNKDSNILARSFFPLYQLYTVPEAGGLNIRTAPASVTNEKTTTDPYFAGINIQFDSLKKQQQFPLLTPYIRPLRRLMLKASKAGNDQVKVELVIQLDEPSKNALLSIAENFK